MPVHDWTKVDAGTFHAFHGAWITHIMGRLNGGVLPRGYYALSEQYLPGLIPDVLTLNRPDAVAPPDSGPPEGGIALAEAPPRTGRKLVADPSAVYRARRRTLIIRHSGGHRIVALLEILSPGIKDRASSVLELVNKVDAAVMQGIYVMVGDLFPPGRFDPRGFHGALWARYSNEESDVPADRPLTVGSYRAVAPVEAYIEHFAFGEPLPEMPLFLDPETYVYAPLEPAYQSAFGDMPDFIREGLEDRRAGSS